MQNVSHFISNILNQIILTSLPMELDQNVIIFIKENLLENLICKMLAISYQTF